MNKHSFWQVVFNNLSSVATVVAAVAALILSQVTVIPQDLLLQIVIALLALIAISLLVDYRRSLSSVNGRIDQIAKLLEGQGNASIQRFNSVDDALNYLADRTRSARIAIDQASIDKQRARRADSRLRYENAREETILADRITYRYLGVIDEHRRFSAVKKLIQSRPLYRFYAAFISQPSDALPLLSFTIFDKEEVFTRVPYDVGEEPVYLAIRGSEVANLFAGYFEKMWRLCRKVQSVEEIDALIQAALSKGTETAQVVSEAPSVESK